MEKIGTIIRNHRIAKGLTQEELGSKVFVSKQAVSKWETGRTLPDIEMIRKLCDVLEINNDEILGSSLEETNNSRKWMHAITVISIIIVYVAFFFAFDGFGWIERHTQAGVAYVTVFTDGEVVSTDAYQIEANYRPQDLEKGYKFHIDYGEFRGTILLYDEYEVEFGFINTNNWHNVHLRLDIDVQDGQLVVKQTISYETDNDIYEVIETMKTTEDSKASVFIDGLP